MRSTLFLCWVWTILCPGGLCAQVMESYGITPAQLAELQALSQPQNANVDAGNTPAGHRAGQPFSQNQSPNQQFPPVRSAARDPQTQSIYAPASQYPAATTRPGTARVRPHVTEWNSTGKQAIHVAVLGGVQRPGVYRHSQSQISLRNLLEQAGGVTDQASGAVRIIRQGRSGMQVLLQSQPDLAVLNGDVVLLEQKPAPVTKGVRNSIPARNFAEPLTSPTGQSSGLMHVVCLGLLPRPVVLPLGNRSETIPTLLQKLGLEQVQSPLLRVVPATARSTPPTSLLESPLAEGTVLVFDPAALLGVHLPPLPEVINAAAETAGSAANSTTESVPSGPQQRRLLASPAVDSTVGTLGTSKIRPKIWSLRPEQTGQPAVAPANSQPRTEINPRSDNKPRSETPAAPRAPDPRGNPDATLAPARDVTEVAPAIDPFSFSSHAPRQAPDKDVSLPAPQVAESKGPVGSTSVAGPRVNEAVISMDLPRGPFQTTEEPSIGEVVPPEPRITPGPTRQRAETPSGSPFPTESRTISSRVTTRSRVGSDAPPEPDPEPLPQTGIGQAEEKHLPHPAMAQVPPTQRTPFVMEGEAPRTIRPSSKPAELPPFPGITPASSSAPAGATVAVNPQLMAGGMSSQLAILAVSLSIFTLILVGLWMVSRWGSPELLREMLPPRKSLLQGLVENSLPIVDEAPAAIENIEFHGRPQPTVWQRIDPAAEQPMAAPHLDLQSSRTPRRERAERIRGTQPQPATAIRPDITAAHPVDRVEPPVVSAEDTRRSITSAERALRNTFRQLRVDAAQTDVPLPVTADQTPAMPEFTTEERRAATNSSSHAPATRASDTAGQSDLKRRVAAIQQRLARNQVDAESQSDEQDTLGRALLRQSLRGGTP